MKTIGLIGGMSWESTVTYYQIINRTVKQALGGFHSAKCIINSVDFDGIEHCQSTGNWRKAGEILAGAAKSLEKAGADFVLIGANTMHKVVADIEAAINIPLLHIAEATAKEAIAKNIRKVALTGTKYTMEQDFISSVLEKNGLEVIVPAAARREKINDIIYKELCLGEIKVESKKFFLDTVSELAAGGAEGVILGCTEIGLLINQTDTEIPLLDTAEIHAVTAAVWALK